MLPTFEKHNLSKQEEIFKVYTRKRRDNVIMKLFKITTVYLVYTTSTWAGFLSKNGRARIHISVTDCLNCTSRHILRFT
jgi:hypothetical protein